MKNLLLVQIENPLNWSDFFQAYANVWAVSLINDYSLFSDPDFDVENIGLNFQSDVIAFSVERVQYAKAASLSSLITDQNGGLYYFDINTRLLYVHFTDHASPYSYSDENIFIGLAVGFYKSLAFEGGLFDDTQLVIYDSRLKSAPIPASTLDDRLFLEQKYTAGKIVIDNGDLFYKQFNVGLDETGKPKRNKTGNYARVAFWQGTGEPTYADIEAAFFYQGYIEKTKEGLEIEVGIRDLRKQLDAETPNRKLVNANWPDLSSPDDEHILPEVWGTCYDVPLLCLNEEEGQDDDLYPANYRYMICDTANYSLNSAAVTAIYIDGQKKTIAVLPTVTNDTKLLQCFQPLPMTQRKTSHISTYHLITLWCTMMPVMSRMRAWIK